jgi:hypothetical protein
MEGQKMFLGTYLEKLRPEIGDWAHSSLGNGHGTKLRMKSKATLFKMGSKPVKESDYQANP